MFWEDAIDLIQRSYSYSDEEVLNIPFPRFMQLIEVTQRRDAADKRFLFSQSVFMSYFPYITNYSDPDKKAMSLSEWMSSFIPEEASAASEESIEVRKQKIIDEAEANAAMVMKAFMAQS